MGHDHANFGITLSNRGVLVGLCSTHDLLVLADAVEASSLIGLGVVRRRAVRQPPARCADAPCRRCRPHRTGAARACVHGLVRAAQSAGLCLRVGLARRAVGRRTRLVACAGGGAGPLWKASRPPALNIAPGRAGASDDREHPHASPPLDQQQPPFVGEFTNFANVTLDRKPVQSPCPIWLATNAERLSKGQANSGGSTSRSARASQDRGRLVSPTRSVRRVSAVMGFHPAGRPRPRA